MPRVAEVHVSRTSSSTWKRLRAQVIREALAGGLTRCAVCRTKMDFEYPHRPNSVEVDHIVPHALGGQDTRENVQLLCLACNRSKGKGPVRKPATPRRIAGIASAGW